MRIKSKPQDFRVYELLDDRYVGDKGRFRVYRVTKTKLTSLEAASELALATGVRTSEIGMAGMKDRQGVTTQFMSVRGGKPVRFQTPSLKVETAGFATHALSSRDSVGNGFEIALRGVEPEERAEIEREAQAVRAHGVPNYFGEQRFGNLRHGQGWVAKELALGRHETALKNLLAAPSENDNPHMRSFKRGLDSAWGDWKRCRDVAGAYGAHHSIFEHLASDPEDFAGAFRYVKTEVRLIHLYAFQSHVWNRAVARFVGETSRSSDRLLVPSLEGPLAFSRVPLAVPEAWGGTFRMPGEGLEDVVDEDQRRWLTAALAAEGLNPEDFRIHGVPGFAIKGEDRQLIVRPRALEIFPDRRSDGVLHVSFDLPRGSYATLVLARLAPTRAAETPEDAARRMRREEQDEQRRIEERAFAPRGNDRHGYARDAGGPRDRERDDRQRGYAERRFGPDTRGAGRPPQRDESAFRGPPRDERSPYEPRRDERAPWQPQRDERAPWQPRRDERAPWQPRHDDRPRDESRRDPAASRDESHRDQSSRDESRRDESTFRAPRPDERGGFDPRRDERAPWQPRRDERPAWQPRRDERPRYEPRRDERAPDRSARDDRPRDAGRFDPPRRDEAARFPVRRAEPDRFPSRRGQRPQNPRLAERRFDGPPLEYKPPAEPRYEHQNPDGRRRARPHRTANRETERRDPTPQDRGQHDPEPRGDDRRPNDA